jgi:hypothetical protein
MDKFESMSMSMGDQSSEGAAGTSDISPDSSRQNEDKAMVDERQRVRKREQKHFGDRSLRASIPDPTPA